MQKYVIIFVCSANIIFNKHKMIVNNLVTINGNKITKTESKKDAKSSTTTYY